mmetsp:Transcript_33182/g.75836  ORF Transcript_33182/g.75836 Transcript_33182/m.75836 type:complete len:265 (-) Transcript_33182:1588-2382(-)
MDWRRLRASPEELHLTRNPLGVSGKTSSSSLVCDSRRFWSSNSMSWWRFCWTFSMSERVVLCVFLLLLKPPRKVLARDMALSLGFARAPQRERPRLECAADCSTALDFGAAAIFMLLTLSARAEISFLISFIEAVTASRSSLTSSALAICVSSLEFFVVRSATHSATASDLSSATGARRIARPRRPWNTRTSLAFHLFVRVLGKRPMASLVVPSSGAPPRRVAAAEEMSVGLPRAGSMHMLLRWLNDAVRRNCLRVPSGPVSVA